MIDDTCSARFNIQSEGFISQLWNTVARSNLVYMKTSGSKAAIIISMIMEKPENEILLLQDILPCIYCYCFISE